MSVKGDRRAGNREKMAWEVYGRQGKRGWEAKFPWWKEAVEIRENNATLCGILQSKKPTNVGQELGLKGMGSERFKPPCPPPSPLGKT